MGTESFHDLADRVDAEAIALHTVEVQETQSEKATRGAPVASGLAQVALRHESESKSTFDDVRILGSQVDGTNHPRSELITAFEQNVRSPGVSAQSTETGELMSCNLVSHYVAGYRPGEIEGSTGQDGAIEISQPVLSHSLRYLWYLRQVAANADVVQIKNDDWLGERHVDLRFVI